MADINAIFEARRVVLVGSSVIREKVGMTSPQLFRNVIHNMRKFFRGETYVVDTGGKIGPDRVDDFVETPELAVIMLPPSQSIVRAEECMRIGTRKFVMITGGYKDRQRRRLLGLKAKYSARILGPNTIMGLIDTSSGLNTTFEKDLMPRRGNIAVISQSGGVGACLLDWACSYDVGISKFVFVGDKIDIDDVDLLALLGKDKRTRVICLYMEGVKKGREFIEQAREAARRKPILALKGGVTQESAKRAKSHTASIVGSDEIFDAAFRKAGIVRVRDIEELMDAAVALSKQPVLNGDRVAIVSNVGGPAILAADAVATNGLRLAALSERVKRKIEIMYPGVDASNPIDLIADAKADRYRQVLDLVLSDKNVDGVMAINMLKSTFFEPKDAKVISEVAARHPDKPVVDVPAGGADFASVYKVLGHTNVPVYDLPDKAARALKALRAYGRIHEG